MAKIEWKNPWEEECAALFDELKLKWEYEPRRFHLEPEYVPSFYVADVNVYVDVPDSAYSKKDKEKKLADFKERYPSDTIYILDGFSILDKIFLMQFIFGSNFTRFQHLEGFEKDERTKHFVLSLLEEVIEALREINRKDHVLEKVVVDEEALKEELVDAFHFFVTICLIWGFSPEDITDSYKMKNLKNWDRYRTRLEEKKTKEKNA